MAIIELDRPRALSFGFSALRYLKAEHGFKSIDAIFEVLQDGDFTLVPVLVTSFILADEGENLPLEQVDKILDAKMAAGKYNMKDLMVLLEEVVSTSTLVKGLEGTGKKKPGKNKK